MRWAGTLRVDGHRGALGNVIASDARAGDPFSVRPRSRVAVQ